MLGLLVIIIVSWMLLHFIEKKNIEALGIIPKPKRLIQFLVGMLFMTLINLSYYRVCLALSDRINRLFQNHVCTLLKSS